MILTIYLQKSWLCRHRYGVLSHGEIFFKQIHTVNPHRYTNIRSLATSFPVATQPSIPLRSVNE